MSGACSLKSIVMDHMVDWNVSAIQGGVQGGDHMVDWEVSAWAGASLQSYTYTLPNQVGNAQNNRGSRSLHRPCMHLVYNPCLAWTQARDLTTADFLGWCEQLASVVAYLHGCSPPIVHRDIKLDNVST